MNKKTFKILALFFGIMSFSLLSETHRIMTSDAPDIAPQRGSLTIMAFVALVIFLILTGYFWRKSK